MEVPPNGWFIVEKLLYKNGWFGGTLKIPIYDPQLPNPLKMYGEGGGRQGIFHTFPPPSDTGIIVLTFVLG